MYTTTLYGRLCWSWAFDVIRIAKEKKDLDISDFPKPDHNLRSGNMAAAWASYNLSGKLWRSLLWVYGKTIAMQWLLASVAAALSFLPHYVILLILQALERREAGHAVALETWMLVPLLCFSILLQTVSYFPSHYLHSLLHRH
jgi:hypothetical protein